MKNVVPLLLLFTIIVFIPFSSDATWQNGQQFTGEITAHDYWENTQQFIGEIGSFLSSDLWDNAQQFIGELDSKVAWYNAQDFIAWATVVLTLWENAHQFFGEMESMDYWVNAQQWFSQVISSSGWANIQQFTGFLQNGSAIIGGFEMISYIWLLILFLPGLFMGWFVGRFGFVVGLLVGTSVLFTFNDLPLWLFMIVLIGVGLIFFKGESSGGDF